MKMLIFLSAATLFAGSAMAGISNTRHNLSTSGIGSVKAQTETEICVFCHTPHNATVKNPLWNRNNPTRAIATYAANQSPHINATIPANLAEDSVSRFCLSCHDEITGSGDNIGNNVVNRGPIAMNGDMRPATALLKGNQDLKDDHPVGFRVLDKTEVGIGGDPEINDKTTWGFPLYKSSNGINQLECLTCHDPHRQSLNFLRKTTASGGLCLTCHDKKPTGPH